MQNKVPVKPQAQPMNIRRATTADSPCLSSLCRDVQSLHAGHYPGIFRMPESEGFAVAFFDEMLTNPAVRIFLAENEREALGYLLCQLVERAENPFIYALRYLLIDQISVRPRARGHGIGTALIRQAEACAREWNVSRIQLDSWSFNTEAHAFFEKTGFQRFNHRFWRYV